MRIPPCQEVGKKITFDNVLLYVDGEKVEVGQPYLSNVKVIAEIKLKWE